MHTVELRSDTFGSEIFEYDSKKELFMAVRRLYDNCSRVFANDHVEREIIIAVNSETN